MRQGRASRSGSYGTKVEPKSHAVNEAGVSQIGYSYGEHVTERSRGSSGYRGEPVFKSQGFMAPPVKSQSRNRGSQGKY